MATEFANGGFIRSDPPEFTISYKGEDVKSEVVQNLLKSFQTTNATFTMDPLSISWTMPTKDNTVELVAEETVDNDLIRNDPNGIDQFIKLELARKIAKMMVEEDLIQIQSCEDPVTMTTRVRAKVKIIQE